jgi:hypothetical protein
MYEVPGLDDSKLVVTVTQATAGGKSADLIAAIGGEVRRAASRGTGEEEGIPIAGRPLKCVLVLFTNHVIRVTVRGGATNVTVWTKVAKVTDSRVLEINEHFRFVAVAD